MQFWILSAIKIVRCNVWQFFYESSVRKGNGKWRVHQSLSSVHASYCLGGTRPYLGTCALFPCIWISVGFSRFWHCVGAGLSVINGRATTRCWMDAHSGFRFFGFGHPDECLTTNVFHSLSKKEKPNFPDWWPCTWKCPETSQIFPDLLNSLTISSW